MTHKNQTGNKFMLFLIIWSLVSQIVLYAALLVISGGDDARITSILISPWTLIFNQLLMFILPLGVWLLIKKDSLKSNLPNQPLGGMNIIMLVALSFLLQPLMMTIGGISGLFFHNYIADVLYGFMQYPLWLTLLAIAVTPAICEELVFRGYIQSQHRGHSIRKIALINGLFFAIIHLNLQQFAYTFVLGVIIAYMVHYTRSIWAGILPHFIINASQSLMGRLVSDIGTDAAAPPPDRLIATVSYEVEAVIVMAVFTLLISPILIVVFRAFLKHNRSRMAEPAAQDSDSRYYDYENHEAMSHEYQTFETQSYEPPTPEPQPQEPQQAPPQEAPRAIIDRYAIGVIVIYALIIALLMAA